MISHVDPLKCGYKSQAGFTFIEIFISIVILTVILTLSTEAIDAGRRFYGKIQTTEILKNLQLGFQQAYADNFNLIETNSGQILTFPNNQVSGGPNLLIGQSVRQSNRICSGTNPSTFLPIARYLSSSFAQSYQDGYGEPICIFITPQQNAVINGVNVRYHTIALVSGGRNSTVDPSTNLSATGVLTTVGDDVGVIIDGKSLAQNMVPITLQRLATITSALETYYAARYQIGGGRNPGVDYFANTDSTGAASSLYDSSGSIPSTMGVGVTFPSIGLHTLLGLSITDVTDGFGNLFLFDNSSQAVRSPSNLSASMQQPPYTASTYSNAPGGSVLSQTAVGAY